MKHLDDMYAAAARFTRVTRPRHLRSQAAAERAGVRAATMCEPCQGSGTYASSEYFREKCPHCRGSGMVPR